MENKINTKELRDWEKVFDEVFSWEGNNDPKVGPNIMFTVWEDKTRSLTKPEYIKEFIKQVIEQDRLKILNELFSLERKESFKNLDEMRGWTMAIQSAVHRITNL